ncbi:MAG TPA: HAMP domain-containing protein [Novosphingobium sp.]|nr:HAMP domain-containing protein [Novosphingobium sp.]
MARPNAPRFVVYIALLFLILGIAQLVASLLFYQAIDRQTLHDDHARRIAELLVVSERVHAMSPASISTLMSTGHLTVGIGSTPSVAAPARKGDLAAIAEKITQWEPSLANRTLHLATSDATGGRRDLIGSMRLADGSWLNFRSRDITSMWPVAFRAIALTFATTIASLGIGLAALHLLSKPLRRLAGAADAIGQGREVSIREGGPRDLRNLAHAMNVMQARIARLLKDQAMSFEAISHDLRTPLSRQKVAAELDR